MNAYAIEMLAKYHIADLATEAARERFADLARQAMQGTIQDSALSNQSANPVRRWRGWRSLMTGGRP
jgi:hypothetical protein